MNEEKKPTINVGCGSYACGPVTLIMLILTVYILFHLKDIWRLLDKGLASI